MHILIVDDNPDAADSLGQLVHLMGHEAHLAYDGPTALQVVDVIRPALILLDLAMPRMDGYRVVQHMRGSGVQCTIVALTGYGQASDVARCLSEGFDYHLLKPAAPSDIRELVELVSHPPLLMTPEIKRSQLHKAQ